MPTGRLAHERLEVWHTSRRLIVGADALRKEFPRGYADVRGQLIRAAMAVSRHIGEGAARTSPRDRRRRFIVARGECAECDVILRTVSDLSLASDEAVLELREPADQTAAMLTGLIAREGRRVKEAP